MVRVGRSKVSIASAHSGYTMKESRKGPMGTQQAYKPDKPIIAGYGKKKKGK